MSDITNENLYTREHEWVRIEGSKAEVGITDHAQKALGDIVFVELPKIDDEIDSGDEFGSVESVKAVSSLFMPVSGRVTAVASGPRLPGPSAARAGPIPLWYSYPAIASLAPTANSPVFPPAWTGR